MVAHMWPKTQVNPTRARWCPRDPPGKSAKKQQKISVQIDAKGWCVRPCGWILFIFCHNVEGIGEYKWPATQPDRTKARPWHRDPPAHSANRSSQSDLIASLSPEDPPSQSAHLCTLFKLLVDGLPSYIYGEHVLCESLNSKGLIPTRWKLGC